MWLPCSSPNFIFYYENDPCHDVALITKMSNLIKSIMCNRTHESYYRLRNTPASCCQWYSGLLPWRYFGSMLPWPVIPALCCHDPLFWLLPWHEYLLVCSVSNGACHMLLERKMNTWNIKHTELTKSLNNTLQRK